MGDHRARWNRLLRESRARVGSLLRKGGGEGKTTEIKGGSSPFGEGGGGGGGGPKTVKGKK